MSISKFSFPTTIHFGAGARKLVAEQLRQNGVKRPLIVTDKGLAQLAILHDFAESLEGLEVKVFAGVFGNPTKRQVDEGVSAYKAHTADAVIGFGGGAALDVAKAVAMMAVHEGDVLQYAWDHPQVLPIRNALPYFIALPTTSRTVSQVRRSSVISHDETHLKKIIFN